MAYLLERVGEVRSGGNLLDLGLVRGVAHNRVARHVLVDRGCFHRVRICNRRGRKGRRGIRATLLLHVTERQGKVLVSRLFVGRVSMQAEAVQSNEQTSKRTCIAAAYAVTYVAGRATLEPEAPLEPTEAPVLFIFARILSILEVDS